MLYVILSVHIAHIGRRIFSAEIPAVENFANRGIFGAGLSTARIFRREGYSSWEFFATRQFLFPYIVYNYIKERR